MPKLLFTPVWEGVGVHLDPFIFEYFPVRISVRILHHMMGIYPKQPYTRKKTKQTKTKQNKKQKQNKQTKKKTTHTHTHKQSQNVSFQNGGQKTNFRLVKKVTWPKLIHTHPTHTHTPHTHTFPKGISLIKFGLELKNKNTFLK